MNKNCSFETIAETVILWQNDIVPEYYFIDEFFDEEIFESLDILVTTLTNVVYVFETEFEQIFSKHCDANMSNEKLLNFFESRIRLLSLSNGYLGYILPCAFVREVMYLFKNTFNCLPYFVTAQKCLAKFLERKVKESEAEDILHELQEYCVDINEKFSRFDSFSEEDDDSVPSNEIYNAEFSPKNSSVYKNPKPDWWNMGKCSENESSNLDKTTFNTEDLADFSEDSMQNTNQEDMPINSSSNINIKEKVLLKTNLNKIFEISEAIASFSIEVEKEHKETGQLDFITDIIPSTSNEVANTETQLGIDNELNEMYDILMPDIESRDKVFNLIEKCKDFLEKFENSLT